jgi:hypothetical protein
VPPVVSRWKVDEDRTRATGQGRAGPDRLTIWPVDDGRYGLDATFHGASGYERAEHHQAELTRHGVPHSFRQELDGAWTLRFGPLRTRDVAKALAAFVY